MNKEDVTFVANTRAAMAHPASVCYRRDVLRLLNIIDQQRMEIDERNKWNLTQNSHTEESASIKNDVST